MAPKGRIGILWDTLANTWKAGGDKAGKGYWEAVDYFSPGRVNKGGTWRNNRVYNFQQLFENQNLKAADEILDNFTKQTKLTNTQAQTILTEYAMDPLATIAKYQQSAPEVAKLLKNIPADLANTRNAVAKAVLDSSRKGTRGFGKLMSDRDNMRLAGKGLRYGTYAAGTGGLGLTGYKTYDALTKDDDKQPSKGSDKSDSSKESAAPDNKENQKTDEKKKSIKFSGTRAAIGGGIGGIAGALAAYALSERKNRLRNMLIAGAVTGGVGAGIGGYSA